MAGWLMTSTFYGQWLPSDPRGCVTSVRARRPADPDTRFRIEHPRPGDDYEPPMPGLRRAAQEQNP